MRRSLKIRITVLLSLSAGVLFAAMPQWWIDRGVVDTNATVNDYAPVNQGQVKFMAEQARDEFNVNLPLGAGTNIDLLLGSFTTSQNYLLANIGQLKYIAEPFYERLINIGFLGTYPWGASSNDYAIANIGQFKNLFGFDLTVDTDEDNLPDIWECDWFQTLEESATNDVDGDEISNLLEYKRGTCPTNASDVTRDIDAWEPLLVNAYVLARSGNILFAGGYDGLFLFDISNPVEPELLSQTDFPLSGSARPRMTVYDGYVYGFESREEGLYLFNCTSTMDPFYMGQEFIPTGKVIYAEFNGLITQNDLLYLWDDSGVEIYSLTNPASPQWMASVPDLSTPGTNLMVCGVYEDQDILYVGLRDENYSGRGISIWDVSNPLFPILEGWLASTNVAYEFIRYSNTLYVAEFDFYSRTKSQIVSLDASSGFPTNYDPVATNVYEWRYLSPNSFISDESWLYAFDSDAQTFLTFDASDPFSLHETNSMDLAGSLYDIEFYDSTIYMASGLQGVKIVDVSDPLAPELTGMIGYGGNATDLFSKDDMVFVRRSLGNIAALTISNGVAKNTFEFFAQGEAQGDVENNIAYLAEGYYGLEIFALTSNVPLKLSETNTVLSLDSVVVQSNIVYCGSRTKGALLTLDCSDVSNPLADYTNTALGYIDRLAVSGDRLYVSSFDEGLLILSITNATQPALIGQLNTRSCFRDAVAGFSNIVYAADGVNGVLVLDAADSSEPEQIDRLELEYARRIALSGNSLCVIGYKSVYFISITVPQQPVLQQEFLLDIEPIAVCATTDFFHVLDANNQLHTYFVP